MKGEWFDFEEWVNAINDGFYNGGDDSDSEPTAGLRIKVSKSSTPRENFNDWHDKKHKIKSAVNFIEDELDSNRKVFDDEQTELTLDLFELQDELAHILISKHSDYGPKNISDAPGGALNGIRVRMHDKVARLNNLIDNNKEPKHESIRDTLIDIANYATIALMVIDDKWDK